MTCPNCKCKDTYREDYPQGEPKVVWRYGWLGRHGHGCDEVVKHCPRCGFLLPTETNPPTSLDSAIECKQTVTNHQSPIELVMKAIQCIDYITAMECRYDDEVMEMIGRFAHCCDPSFTCYDTHESWRQELEKFWQDLKDRGEI